LPVVVGGLGCGGEAFDESLGDGRCEQGITGMGGTHRRESNDLRFPRNRGGIDYKE